MPPPLSTEDPGGPELNDSTPATRARCALSPPLFPQDSDEGGTPILSERPEAGLHSTSPPSDRPTRLRVRYRGAVDGCPRSFSVATA